MERKYIFWHTNTGGMIGCLATLITVLGAAVLALFRVRPLVIMAILMPIVGLILYWSIALDRRRSGGGQGRRDGDDADR